MENEREKDKNKSKNDSVEEDKDMTSKDQILDEFNDKYKEKIIIIIPAAILNSFE